MSNLHHCKPRRGNSGLIFPSGRDGVAINECEENEQGELLAGNERHWTQVNFCPFCGYKAKRQIAWLGDAPDVPVGYFATTRCRRGYVIALEGASRSDLDRVAKSILGE